MEILTEQQKCIIELLKSKLESYEATIARISYAKQEEPWISVL